MTVSVSSLQTQAFILLQDVAETRWSRSELLYWLNAGQREIVLMRPEISITTTDVTTAAGSRQTLPTGAIHLLDVTYDRTMGTSISPVAKSVLDSNVPAWQAQLAGFGINHYVYDIRNPLVYWVYPAPNNTRSVEISFCTEPTEATTVITIPDIFSPALLNYMLARALSKDSESAIPPLAAVYYRDFAGLVSGAQAYRPADPAALPGNAAFNSNTP